MVLQVLKNDNQLRNADAELQQRAVEYLSLSVRTSSDVLVRTFDPYEGEDPGLQGKQC